MGLRDRTVFGRVAEHRNNGHVLTRVKPGTNRYRPGSYTCSCGDEFTGMNKWEQHRADAKRTT